MALLYQKFHSDVLNCDAEMNVILPDKAQDAQTGGSCPVLYLLHGLGDSHLNWTAFTDIEKYVEGTGFAVIMPYASIDWYTDMRDGQKWRTFLGEELPAVCHTLYPQLSTKREDTYIGGVSMGGYGTYALALTYPEKYHAAFGFSGAYTLGDDPNALDLVKNWNEVFGPREEYHGSKNDLCHLSEQLLASGRPLPKLWMWCGYSDFLYDHSIRMRDHLHKLNWPDFHYEESDGDHSWICWNIKAQDMLTWIMEERNNR
ncbi:MAG: esterase family protein [Ruminococcaceae bacterium]|nr:esterase family protein [Oscillospiraceae bacterium]